MKIFVIATISAVAFSTVEAARTRNRFINAANSLDCKMDSEAPEKFIECFYKKHASEFVNDRTEQYKRVASRITSALEKAGDNKDKQRKYTKAILIRNANLFGQEKQQMKDLFDNNVDAMDDYISFVKENINVEEAREFLSGLQHKTISEIENNFVKFLNGAVDDAFDKYASKLPKGITEINTGEAISEVQNAIKSLPQVKEFLNENSNKSLDKLMEKLVGKVQDKAEELDIKGQFDEIKNQLN